MQRALNLDFEAFLAPGERLFVEGDSAPEYVHAQLILRSADRSSQLDLEAVILPEQDLKPEQRDASDDPRQLLDLLFDFLRVQLYEFFRQDRLMRFHIDWRVYTFEEHALRLRGSLRRPDLIARADELLEEGEAGEPMAE